MQYLATKEFKDLSEFVTSKKYRAEFTKGV
jgi:hypothetical protein